MTFAFASAICLAGAGCSSPGSTATEPILFVHGYNRNASDWDLMIRRFAVEGWPRQRLSAYSYDTRQSNKTAAAQDVRSHVESLLEATGAEKVDIVAHSMGSINTRWYIKFLGGASKVDDWVSLGGPNHGSMLGSLCPRSIASCAEMRPDSRFLNELNAGDETPGAVNYGTWWSRQDGILNPSTTVPLTGATNTEAPGVNHLKLLQDINVYIQVRDFVK